MRCKDTIKIYSTQNKQSIYVKQVCLSVIEVMDNMICLSDKRCIHCINKCIKTIIKTYSFYVLSTSFLRNRYYDTKGCIFIAYFVYCMIGQDYLGCRKQI